MLWRLLCGVAMVGALDKDSCLICFCLACERYLSLGVGYVQVSLLSASNYSHH